MRRQVVRTTVCRIWLRDGLHTGRGLRSRGAAWRSHRYIRWARRSAVLVRWARRGAVTGTYAGRAVAQSSVHWMRRGVSPVHWARIGGRTAHSLYKIHTRSALCCAYITVVCRGGEAAAVAAGSGGPGRGAAPAGSPETRSESPPTGPGRCCCAPRPACG